MKRWLKTFVILVAIFLAPMVWLSFSHFAAKHALERYKAQLRAAGEKLTIDELLPPPLRPDQNGTKLMEQAFRHMSNFPSIRLAAMRMVAPGKAMIGWQQPEIASPQFTNSWADVERESKAYNSGIEFLHQASGFSRIEFLNNYRDLSDVDVHRAFSSTYMVVMVLSTAIILDLHQGRITSSVTNLHTFLSFYLNAWKNETAPPFQEMRMSYVQNTLQLQWEILQATNLTDAELALLQRDWESINFFRDIEHALEVDRVLDDITTQGFRTSNSLPSSSSGRIEDLARGASRRASDIFWRISWSYRDELRVLQRDQATIDCVRQIETNGFFKDADAEQERMLSAIPLDDTTNNWLRGHLEDELGPSLWNAVNRRDNGIIQILYAEAARRITITAIALKRYQLRHQTWPADLKALVPEFLPEVPRDPVDGRPLRYRPNADGTFTLYSIGSDNKDDGGDPTPVTGPLNLSWLHGRDWVWPQPATPEEIQQYYIKLRRGTSVYK